MCLSELECPKEVKEFKKTLPVEFDVWKVVYGKRTEYHQKDEPILKEKGVYKAEFFGAHRARLRYKPGFHAFFTKKDAEVNFSSWT